MIKPDEELKQFAEALLDVDRLKIVGELARGGGSIPALAQRVGMDVETVIAHLEKLSKTGVVSLLGSQPGDLAYTLDEQALAEMSKRQFQRVRAQAPREPDLRPIGEQFSPEEQKHIRSFTDPNGIIRSLPSTRKREKLFAVLRYAMQDLKPGQIYTEAEFNQALARFTRDAASVRRDLVDLGFVERKADGSAYWLKEGDHD